MIRSGKQPRNTRSYAAKPQVYLVDNFGNLGNARLKDVSKLPGNVRYDVQVHDGQRVVDSHYGFNSAKMALALRDLPKDRKAYAVVRQPDVKKMSQNRGKRPVEQFDKVKVLDSLAEDH